MMNFLFYSPVTNLQNLAVKHMSLSIPEPLDKITEEKDFFIDSTHLNVQLTSHTEDCVAAGCPEGLW